MAPIIEITSAARVALSPPASVEWEYERQQEVGDRAETFLTMRGDTGSAMEALQKLLNDIEHSIEVIGNQR